MSEQEEGALVVRLENRLASIRQASIRPGPGATGKGDLPVSWVGSDNVVVTVSQHFLDDLSEVKQQVTWIKIFKNQSKSSPYKMHKKTKIQAQSFSQL